MFRAYTREHIHRGCGTIPSSSYSTRRLPCFPSPRSVNLHPPATTPPPPQSILTADPSQQPYPYSGIARLPRRPSLPARTGTISRPVPFRLRLPRTTLPPVSEQPHDRPVRCSSASSPSSPVFASTYYYDDRIYTPTHIYTRIYPLTHPHTHTYTHTHTNTHTPTGAC